MPGHTNRDSWLTPMDPNRSVTPPDPGIDAGYSISPSVLEPMLGRALDPRVYQVNMLGHRLFVALDTPDEMHKGLLVIPETTREREQWEYGAGWVVAVGPLVGQPGSPHPTGLQSANPTDILGKHIFFFSHVGKVFQIDRQDSAYSAGLVIMTDRDIQAVDENPEIYKPRELTT